MNLIKAFTIISLFLLVYMLSASPVYADQGGASGAISSAESNLKNCYDAVKQAEAASANVDSLMITINDAAALLSKADLAYAGEDYDSAYNYATQSQSVLSGFTSQAATLKESATEKVSQNSMFVVLSLGASFALLCAGLVAWFLLGKRQRRSIHAA